MEELKPFLKDMNSLSSGDLDVVTSKFPAPRVQILRSKAMSEAKIKLTVSDSQHYIPVIYNIPQGQTAGADEFPAGALLELVDYEAIRMSNQKL
jgi:hypothetical protein